MVQHLSQDQSSHYVKKLTDFGNGIFSKTNRNSQYNSTSVLISKDDIIEVYTNKVFYVKSQSEEETYYQVDMTSGFCECPVGSSRAPCKHKHSIKNHYSISEFTSLPVDAGSKAMWHFIALGRCEDRSWYRDDNGADDNGDGDVEQYINDHLPAQGTENEVIEDNDAENNDDSDNEDEHDNNDVDRADVNDDDRDDNIDDLSDNDDELSDNDDEDEDNPDNDFDTEWNDFQSIVNQMGEKFKGYWSDENFRKAFRKFKWQC